MNPVETVPCPVPRLTLTNDNSKNRSACLESRVLHTPRRSWGTSFDWGFTDAPTNASTTNPVSTHKSKAYGRCGLSFLSLSFIVVPTLRPLLVLKRRESRAPLLG